MPNEQVVYAILRDIDLSRATRTYGDLSALYQDQTGVWFEPFGSWDAVLGEINRRLEAANLPPLSAVIVNQRTRQPGGRFWGCCTRTQNPPQTAQARQLEHIAILGEVYAATWPQTLP